MIKNKCNNEQMVLGHGLVCIQVYTHTVFIMIPRGQKEVRNLCSLMVFSTICPDSKVQHSPVSLVASPRLGGAGGGPRRSVA